MTREKRERDVTWFDALRDAKRGKAPEEAGKPVPNEAKRRDVTELLGEILASPKSTPANKIAVAKLFAELYGFKAKRPRENLSEHSEEDLLELIHTVVAPALAPFGVVIDDRTIRRAPS